MGAEAAVEACVVETEGEVETEGDTVAVLEVRGSARRRRGQRAEEKRANSAGRTTHAARIADEVHMDPPPQAHIGVGHVSE
ncbi:hypothetical protein GCM10010449_64780 [Streptomyces rectiviolaceus]|uniref:Uncharacterized protein n=1 Tax=Streptomyces rectiviolaceus TaxID=332591 RepID=A0ABP6N4P9_9ACTN